MDCEFAPLPSTSLRNDIASLEIRSDNQTTRLLQGVEKQEKELAHVSTVSQISERSLEDIKKIQESVGASLSEINDKNKIISDQLQGMEDSIDRSIYTQNNPSLSFLLNHTWKKISNCCSQCCTCLKVTSVVTTCGLVGTAIGKFALGSSSAAAWGAGIGIGGGFLLYGAYYCVSRVCSRRRPLP